MISITLPRKAEDSTPPTQPPDVEKRPGRLVLRRQLLRWSAPAAVLLLVLVVKLASIGILGGELPGQFADRNGAAMRSTLGWIDFGKPGRGFREDLADGDRALLDNDLPGALQHFKTALDKDPSACPARANFALTAETMSDNEVHKGNFANARKLLEPAVDAANADKECFATSTAETEDVRKTVKQTPTRLANKLAALKAGRLTKTPDGYDYIRDPKGEVDIPPTDTGGQCPADDDAAQRDCINKQDQLRAQQQQAQAGQGNQPGPGPGPDQGPADDKGPQFPDPAKPSNIPFCNGGTGNPLHDLGAELCWTAGPPERTPDK